MTGTWNASIIYPFPNEREEGNQVNNKCTWSGDLLKDGVCSISSFSLTSSSYPNLRRTVHVVSSRPRSIKSAWRDKNPVNVKPRSFTPSGSFSDTTFFTPATSDGCRGALKHFTYDKERSRYLKIPKRPYCTIRPNQDYCCLYQHIKARTKKNTLLI